MTPDQGYRVDRLGPVVQAIRTLGRTAAARGIFPEYMHALKVIHEQLRTRPLDWGDPERRTRKKGGWVYHGYHTLLLVHYVVYEAERAVCVMEIQPFPASPLD